jgi:hypothetical protein
MPSIRIHKSRGRPISRILLYPAIHLRGIPGLPLGSCAYQSHGTEPPLRTIWLARTGGLPGRSLSGYRRWALTPPFHPSPVPAGTIRTRRPSAGLLSVALDVTGGLHHPAPRVGWPERPLLRVRTLLYAWTRGPRTQRRVGRPRPAGLYLTSRNASSSRPRVGRAPSWWV